jgi:phosphoesterase RecJ-like protein
MNKLIELIGSGKRIAIGGHIRPDGDCVGSCLAAYNYIIKTFKETAVDLYLEQPSSVFSYIKNVDKIDSEMEEEKEYDVFLALDCSDAARLGKALKYFDTAKKTVCVDHHISNCGFADINVIAAKASSTCEVLFGLLDEEKMDSDIAAALYTGIVHDTGVFRHSSTSSYTMQIAGKLMEKGIAFSKIIEESFYEKTYVQNQILGRTLLESITFLEGKCIFSAVKKSDMEFYGVTPKDLDGIIDQLKSTKGVEVAIFLYETGVQEYKVSMRSKEKVDVSKIASFFGGGGHIRAAGCTMIGSMHDVINNLSAHIVKQL